MRSLFEISPDSLSTSDSMRDLPWPRHSASSRQSPLTAIMSGALVAARPLPRGSLDGHGMEKVPQCPGGLNATTDQPCPSSHSLTANATSYSLGSGLPRRPPCPVMAAPPWRARRRRQDMRGRPPGGFAAGGGRRMGAPRACAQARRQDRAAAIQGGSLASIAAGAARQIGVAGRRSAARHSSPTDSTARCRKLRSGAAPPSPARPAPRTPLPPNLCGLCRPGPGRASCDRPDLLRRMRRPALEPARCAPALLLAPPRGLPGRPYNPQPDVQDAPAGGKGHELCNAALRRRLLAPRPRADSAGHAATAAAACAGLLAPHVSGARPRGSRHVPAGARMPVAHRRPARAAAPARSARAKNGAAHQT